MIKVLLLLAASGCLLALVSCRRSKLPAVSGPGDSSVIDSGDPAIGDTGDDGDEYDEEGELVIAELHAAMDPATPRFLLATRGPASFSGRRIPLQGRLQIYVRDGSQYATWRQFPMAIRFEVRNSAGKVSMTADVSLSISDSPESYEGYAAESANRVVGKDFGINAFDKLTKEFLSQEAPIDGPGKYSIRAHYQGSDSNWVDIDIKP